jgi:hypothetical protein
MPSFFIRARSVLGWSSRIFAAPFDPSIIPLVCSSATTMWSLSTSSSGRGLFKLGARVMPQEDGGVEIPHDFELSDFQV